MKEEVVLMLSELRSQIDDTISRVEKEFDGKYIPLDHRVKISSSGNIFVTPDLINTFMPAMELIKSCCD